MLNITLLNRLLGQIRAVVGLPDEIEQRITALDTLDRAARDTHPDRRAAAETAAVAALVEAAGTGRSLPADVEAKVTEAAGLDASADARNRLIRRAVAAAESDLFAAAQDHAEQIITGRLRPRVQKALECLPDAARLIPAGMDDADAFRAAGEVQNAYRKLSHAAELVAAVVEARRQMCNDTGRSVAIDHPSPNVFRPNWGGGLRYGLVSNPYVLDRTGAWPAGEMPMSDRLLALHRAGAVFHLATGEEITALVAADVEQHRKDNPPPAKRAANRATGF